MEDNLFPLDIRGLRFPLLICIGLIATETMALSLARHSVLAAWMVDYFFLILSRLLLTDAYAWRVTKAVSLRTHWILIGSGMLLAVAALSMQSLVYYQSAVLHGTVNPVANYTDLIYSLSGVPIIILLTLPSPGKPYPRAFFWIDTAQAILWGYIVYLKLFGVIPFTSKEIHPASAHTQITFNIATVAIAIVVALLRFISATTVDERNFFRFYTILFVVTQVMLNLWQKTLRQLCSTSFSGQCQS